MTKTEVKALRREANRVIAQYKEILHLGEWYIKVCFEESPSVHEHLVAEITPSTAYMDAVMSVFPRWMTLSEERRKDVLVHELAHCVTQDLYDCASKLLNGRLVTVDQLEAERERLTQKITNLAVRT